MSSQSSSYPEKSERRDDTVGRCGKMVPLFIVGRFCLLTVTAHGGEFRGNISDVTSQYIFTRVVVKIYRGGFCEV